MSYSFVKTHAEKQEAVKLALEELNKIAGDPTGMHTQDEMDTVKSTVVELAAVVTVPAKHDYVVSVAGWTQKVGEQVVGVNANVTITGSRRAAVTV